MPDLWPEDAHHDIDDPRADDLPASEPCPDCGETFRPRWAAGTDEHDDICTDCRDERALRLLKACEIERRCACNKSHCFPSDGACGCSCHEAVWGPRGGR